MINKDRIQIRPSKPTDFVGIQNVWRDAFGKDVFLGNQEKFDSYAHWAYSKNPDSTPSAITSWVADSDGEVVGVWSTVPVKMIVNGSEVEACWLQNTAVASRAQRMGIGKKFFRTILSNYPLILGVGVTEGSRALYQSEHVNFVRADMFGVLSLSPATIIRDLLRAIKRGQLRRAKDIAVCGIRQFVFRRVKIDDIQVEAQETLEHNVDGLVNRFANTIPVMPLRSTTKANWMIANPLMKVRAFTAIRHGVVSGYALVRHDGLILELIALPQDWSVFSALLCELKRWAKNKGLAELSGIMASNPGFAEMYIRAGFLEEIRNDFGFFYVLGDGGIARPVLDDAKNWHLSMSDSDLWTFRLFS